LELRRASHDSWHGWDKKGHPVFIERFGLVDSEEIGRMASSEERVYYHHYINEWVQRVLLIEASKRAGHLIDQVTTVFDMYHFSRSNITKSNYSFVSSTISINSLLYPEIMSACLIVNAPFVFTVGWNMVKSAIDEVTRAKITIVKGLFQDKINAVIDAKHVPTVLGGSCDCVTQHDNTTMCTSELDVMFEEYVKARSSTHTSSSDDETSKGGVSVSGGELSVRMGSDSLSEMEAEFSSARGVVRRVSESTSSHRMIHTSA
jgi:hypothetical protein